MNDVETYWVGHGDRLVVKVGDWHAGHITTRGLPTQWQAEYRHGRGILERGILYPARSTADEAIADLVRAAYNDMQAEYSAGE